MDSLAAPVPSSDAPARPTCCPTGRAARRRRRTPRGSSPAASARSARPSSGCAPAHCSELAANRPVDPNAPETCGRAPTRHAQAVLRRHGITT